MPTTAATVNVRHAPTCNARRVLCATASRLQLLRGCCNRHDSSRARNRQAPRAATRHHQLLRGWYSRHGSKHRVVQVPSNKHLEVQVPRAQRRLSSILHHARRRHRLFIRLLNTCITIPQPHPRWRIQWSQRLMPCRMSRRSQPQPTPRRSEALRPHRIIMTITTIRRHRCTRPTWRHLRRSEQRHHHQRQAVAAD